MKVTHTKVTCEVRPDILEVGRRFRYHSLYYPSRLGADKRIAIALQHLSMETCGAPDSMKDALRLYIETWVIPPLEQAFDQVKPKGKKRP